MRIKRNPLDILFSKWIKARDKYCQRCGGTGGLQTSHFFGRAKRSVRWDEENCCLLCFGCHMYFTAHPLEHTDWFQERLGDRFVLLKGRAYTTHPKVDIEILTLYFKELLKK